MNTFTKQEWQQIVADKLSGDRSITHEEIQEILDYLWDYLPPVLHSSVIKELENKKKWELDRVKNGGFG